MHTFKLQAGDAFPSIIATDGDGTSRDLSEPLNEADWMMPVVYRGMRAYD